MMGAFFMGGLYVAGALGTLALIIMKLFNISTGFGQDPKSLLRCREPEVRVELTENLHMKRGKKRRLECCPGKARLRMRIWDGVGPPNPSSPVWRLHPPWR